MTACRPWRPDSNSRCIVRLPERFFGWPGAKQSRPARLLNKTPVPAACSLNQRPTAVNTGHIASAVGNTETCIATNRRLQTR